MRRRSDHSGQVPPDPALQTRREILVAGAMLAGAPFLSALTSDGDAAQATRASASAASDSAWSSYGADKASSKYSALAQIDRSNFSRLRVAWTWRSAEASILKENPQLRSWA